MLPLHRGGEQGNDDQNHKIENQALDTGMDAAKLGYKFQDNAVVVKNADEQPANGPGFGGPGPEEGGDHQGQKLDDGTLISTRCSPVKSFKTSYNVCKSRLYRIT